MSLLQKHSDFEFLFLSEDIRYRMFEDRWYVDLYESLILSTFSGRGGVFLVYISG